MYPWEHLLLGYVLFSVYAHWRYRESPTGGQTIAVVAGSLLPDIVDKPLAWTFEIVESAYAIGHSIFVAPFVGVAVYVLARRFDRPRTGVAFMIAYLSHLASDIVYPVAFGMPIEPRVVLWPLASPPSSTIEGGFIERATFYVRRFVVEMTTGGLSTFVRFQLFFVGAVTLLWLYDGAPVAMDAYRFLRRLMNERLFSKRGR